MSPHNIPEMAIPQEVPLVIYNGEKRVVVGRAVVLDEGIAAIFDDEQPDEYVASIVKAITEGSVTGLSVAPVPTRDQRPYPKERDR